MKIALFTGRTDYKFLGGDRLCDSLLQGLRELGHETILSSSIDDVIDADCVILTSHFNADDVYHRAIQFAGKPYVYIPFFDDYTQFYRVMKSFYYYVAQLILKPSKDLTLELLWDVPEILHYNDIIPNNVQILHRAVYQEALFCLTNSKAEAKALKRTYRDAKVETIYLPPGQVSEEVVPYSDRFLGVLKGLTKGSYLLQIGRFEMRKNQLATILASKDLDIPLVLISSDILTNYFDYASLCIEAIKKWRKAPTYIFSRYLEPYDDGLLHIIKLDKDSLFDQEMITSAFQNAGLYVHPAFSELPGYVYLEAVKLGTPIIASEWTTIKDYFIAEDGTYQLDDQIRYVLPHHLHEIENGIKEHFGVTYPTRTFPILEKTNRAFAEEFCEALSRHLPFFSLPK